MRVNEFSSNNYAGISAVSAGTDGNIEAASYKKGDVLTGVVTSVEDSVNILFDDQNKELTFSKKDISNAYVGQKRAFEVLGSENGKLLLRDLGGMAEEISARGIMSARVDYGMPEMVEDFSETMGDTEQESASVSRMSEEDYSLLKQEGFSIEDFKAERLVRALARIKAERESKKQDMEAQVDGLRRDRADIRKRAMKNALAKYEGHRSIMDAITGADLPMTDENIDAILGAVMMSGEITAMSDKSVAYIIKNELPPTVRTVYRSVYCGGMRSRELPESDWESLRGSVKDIIDEANRLIETDELIRADSADEEDARFLLEHDIPVSAESIIYKKELEELKKTGRTEDEVARAAAKAMSRGREAQDGILIASHETVVSLSARLRLQEIRLELTERSEQTLRRSGLDVNTDAIRRETDELREEVKQYYRLLAEETGIEPDKTASACELALETALTLEDIAEAPVTLYGNTFTVRSSITLEELGVQARSISVSVSAAINGYDASATQIRGDLGDSINKAFGSIDSLLEGEGFELTEANRRAARILGYNSMEFTSENIEAVKYYDAKVTALTERMKPSVVMTMIRRGVNPLEKDIDSLMNELREISDAEGGSPEERFSTFLVRMEENEAVSEREREAYIGVYRLLYQIEKSDGAAIGAAVASGRKLTLKNLLTEARLRQGYAVDVNVDDDTLIRTTTYVNSITDQLEHAFSQPERERTEYNKELVRNALQFTEPETWAEAFSDEDIPELTVEQAVERLIEAERTTGDDLAEQAARIRSVMSTGGSTRRFLRSLGVDDSVRNIEAMESSVTSGGEPVVAAEEELSLSFTEKEKLLETMTGPESLIEAFEAAEEKKRKDTVADLLGVPAAELYAGDIMTGLDRFGLLKSMARSEHYRLRLEGDTPAGINLTVVHAGTGGSLSIELSCERYHIRATLNASSRDRLDGSVTCDSTGETDTVNKYLPDFVNAIKEEGFDASGIMVRVDRITPDMYLSRLGEMKQRAQENDGQASTEKIPTSDLYMIAKRFIETMLG